MLPARNKDGSYQIKTSARKKQIAISIVLAIIAFATAQGKRDAETGKIARQIAEKINSMAPLEVAGNMEIVSAAANGKYIDIVHRTRTSTQSWAQGELHRFAFNAAQASLPALCAYELAADFLSRGGIFAYAYEDTHGVPISKSYIDKDDCKPSP